jgi:hypothetical protein
MYSPLPFVQIPSPVPTGISTFPHLLCCSSSGGWVSFTFTFLSSTSTDLCPLPSHWFRHCVRRREKEGVVSWSRPLMFIPTHLVSQNASVEVGFYGEGKGCKIFFIAPEVLQQLTSCSFSSTLLRLPYLVLQAHKSFSSLSHALSITFNPVNIESAA